MCPIRDPNLIDDDELEKAAKYRDQENAKIEAKDAHVKPGGLRQLLAYGICDLLLYYPWIYKDYQKNNPGWKEERDKIIIMDPKDRKIIHHTHRY